MSPREPVIPEPDRDPQQFKLYAAEREFEGSMLYAGDMSMSAARHLVAQVCKVYDLPRVALVTTRKPRAKWGAQLQSTYNKGRACRATLTVNRSHSRMNALTLLHELSHAIVDHYFGMDEPPHGQQFVGISSWLYEQFRVLPSDAYRVILRRHGVRGKTATECSPQALRNWRSRHASV